MAAGKKDLIKRLLLAVPGFQALCRWLSRDHVRVLMYHRFSAGSGDSQKLGIANFSAHLEYISRHHAVWTADEHLRSWRNKRPVTDCPVVVTIDDGYADFAAIAQPKLDQYAVPAVLFVVTDFVSGKIWFWWDKLRFVLDHTTIFDRELHLLDQAYQLSLTDQESRDVAWGRIATDLSRLTPDDIATQVDIIAAELNVALPESAPDEYAAVSWQDLQQATSKSLLLGAHTTTHPALSRIEAQRAAEEIDTSRKAIIAHTGACSDVFCYPHGQRDDYSQDTVAVVEGLGFSGAYVAFESAGDSPNAYEMQRYSVHDDWIDFRWKLCGAQYLLQRF